MTNPNPSREPGSGETRRQSDDAGLVPWSVFERALAAHVADRDRIAQAIADADPTADDAPHRYQRMAEAAMDAMDADR